MNLPSAILGKSAVDQITERSGATVLQIGADRLTRADLAAVGCFNFIAARLLTEAARELHVDNLRDLYEHVAPRALALPNVGAVSLAVLGAAFEAKGIGGAAPLESYVKKHLPSNGQQTILTFDTIKQHERAAQQASRRHRRGRT